MSLVLRLLGREPDPAKSREHVLLSVLAERRLLAGQTAELGALMQDVLEPPITRIGALSVNAFMKTNERKNLVAALNSLLAALSFASWRQGTTLDVGAWLTPSPERPGKTPIVIVSVAGATAPCDEPHARADDALGDQSGAWGEGCGAGARDRAARGASEAERALGRGGVCRLRLADQLNRDLASAPTDEPAQGGLALEARGRLLVYTGPIDASELDHRADREARINASSEQPNARRV